MRYWKVIVHWLYWIWVVLLKGKKTRQKEGKIEEKWTGNNIGAEGCRIISEVLKENSTLIKVNLLGDKRNMKNCLTLDVIKTFLEKATG